VSLQKVLFAVFLLIVINLIFLNGCSSHTVKMNTLIYDKSNVDEVQIRKEWTTFFQIK